MDDKKRPTLGELASKSNDPWTCPKCGCRDWRTINSYLCKDGTRHRRKYCRNCYHIRTTYESFEKPSDDSDSDDVSENAKLLKAG